MLNHEYIDPDVVFTPQKAFYHDKKSVLLRESVGHIAGEFVMCYPPGIPILAPGERITKDIIEYIIYAKEKGSVITGPKDMKIEYINIIDF
jgi:lysine decarboxylase